MSSNASTFSKLLKAFNNFINDNSSNQPHRSLTDYSRSISGTNEVQIEAHREPLHNRTDTYIKTFKSKQESSEAIEEIWNGIYVMDDDTRDLVSFLKVKPERPRKTKKNNSSNIQNQTSNITISSSTKDEALTTREVRSFRYYKARVSKTFSLFFRQFETLYTRVEFSVKLQQTGSIIITIGKLIRDLIYIWTTGTKPRDNHHLKKAAENFYAYFGLSNVIYILIFVINYYSDKEATMNWIGSVFDSAKKGKLTLIFYFVCLVLLILNTILICFSSETRGLIFNVKTIFNFCKIISLSLIIHVTILPVSKRVHTASIYIIENLYFGILLFASARIFSEFEKLLRKLYDAMFNVVRIENTD